LLIGHRLKTIQNQPDYTSFCNIFAFLMSPVKKSFAPLRGIAGEFSRKPMEAAAQARNLELVRQALQSLS
jgi:hypothetical protein